MQTETEERTIEQVAFEYGQASACRFWHSTQGGIRNFNRWDAKCNALQDELIERGAYEDDLNSVFKDEIWPHFMAGYNRTRKGKAVDGG